MGNQRSDGLEVWDVGGTVSMIVHIAWTKCPTVGQWTIEKDKDKGQRTKIFKFVHLCPLVLFIASKFIVKLSNFVQKMANARNVDKLVH